MCRMIGRINGKHDFKDIDKVTSTINPLAKSGSYKVVGKNDGGFEASPNGVSSLNNGVNDQQVILRSSRNIMIRCLVWWILPF